MEDDYYLRLEPFNILYEQLGNALKRVIPWVLSGILLGIIIMIIISKLPFEIDSIPENIDNTDIYEEMNKNAKNEELKNNEMSVNDTLKNIIPIEDQKKLKKMLKKAGVKRSINKNQSFDNSFHMFNKADMIIIILLLSILVGVIYKDYGISPFSKIISFFSRELGILSSIIRGG